MFSLLGTSWILDHECMFTGSGLTSLCAVNFSITENNVADMQQCLNAGKDLPVCCSIGGVILKAHSKSARCGSNTLNCNLCILKFFSSMSRGDDMLSYDSPGPLCSYHHSPPHTSLLRFLHSLACNEIFLFSLACLSFFLHLSPATFTIIHHFLFYTAASVSSGLPPF